MRLCLFFECSLVISQIAFGNAELIALEIYCISVLQQYPHVPRSFGEMDGVEIFQQRDCVFTGGLG